MNYLDDLINYYTNFESLNFDIEGNVSNVTLKKIHNKQINFEVVQC